MSPYEQGDSHIERQGAATSHGLEPGGTEEADGSASGRPGRGVAAAGAARRGGLEGRGPSLALVEVIDDAAGKAPAALFRRQEDAQGSFLLLHEIIHRQGIPLALS